MFVPSASGQTFSNPAPITVPAGAPVTTTGVSTPYPSTIAVSGAGTSLTSRTVTLASYSHAFPDDVDMLLVGPTGAAFRLLTDCGGSIDAVSLTLTLSDGAGSALSDAGPLAAGTFLPSSYGAVAETFPSPAPGGAHPAAAAEGTATFASVFGGTDPNGIWSLYVVDDTSGDVGSISGGWSLTVVATPVELSRFDAE